MEFLTDLDFCASVLLAADPPAPEPEPEISAAPPIVATAAAGEEIARADVPPAPPTAEPETVPCRICSTPTTARGSRICPRCWELEHRIHADPEIAAGILQGLGYLVQAPGAAAPAPTRKRARKEAHPAGWSAAAWEYYSAAQRAKTYAALAPDKLNDAAQRACEKAEGAPEPNPTFRARFPYLPPAENVSRGDPLQDERRAQESAITALGALGVPGSALIFETEAEYLRRDLLFRYRETYHQLGSLAEQLRHASQPDSAAARIRSARKMARELLAAGERGNARELVERIRRADRALSAHFPAYSKHGS